MAANRWGTYERISELTQEERAAAGDDGTGRGVKRQRKDIRAMIRVRDPGGTVVDSYTDDDTSAYSGRPRKEYERLLADIAGGRIDAVGAWHNDRLHRPDLRKLEDFLDLIQAHGTRVETVLSGTMDLSTAAGRAFARQVGVWARYESEHRAERIRSRHAEIAASGGLLGGGYRPYGHLRVYDRPERPHKLVAVELVPEEAEVIRECARRFLAGEGLRTIALDLNRRGILTSAGCQWSTATLTRVLASARIAGMREHQDRPRSATARLRLGEITAENAAWPAIITPAQSGRLRGILGSKSRRTSPGRTGRYLCAGGVLYCEGCEKRMAGKSRGPGRPALYFCDGDPGRPGCGRRYIDAGGTDLAVAAWVSAALAGPGFREALARQDPGQPDDSALLDDITLASEKMLQNARDEAEDRITRAEWLERRKTLQERIERSRRQLSRADAHYALDGIPSGEEDLRAWLLNPEIPVARRRTVILAVLEKVTVAPAVKGRARFDVSRLTPVWQA